jgi:hypothetical protein
MNHSEVESLHGWTDMVKSKGAFYNLSFRTIQKLCRILIRWKTKLCVDKGCENKWKENSSYTVVRSDKEICTDYTNKAACVSSLHLQSSDKHRKSAVNVDAILLFQLSLTSLSSFSTILDVLYTSVVIGCGVRASCCDFGFYSFILILYQHEFHFYR